MSKTEPTRHTLSGGGDALKGGSSGGGGDKSDSKAEGGARRPPGSKSRTNALDVLVAARQYAARVRWVKRLDAPRGVGLLTTVFMLMAFVAIALVQIGLVQSGALAKEQLDSLWTDANTLWIAIGLVAVLSLLRVRPTAYGYCKPARVDLILGVGFVVAGGLIYVVVLTVFALASDINSLEGLILKTAGNRELTARIVIGLIVIPPLAEELLFRGVAYTALRREFGPGAALLASAFVFALAHYAYDSGAGPQAYANHFLGGMIFGLAYERTGALWVPMLLHFCGNGMLLVSRLVLDSGVGATITW